MVAAKYGEGSMETVLPRKASKCQLGGLEATEVGEDGQIHNTMIQVDLAKLVLRLHVETIATHMKDRKNAYLPQTCAQRMARSDQKWQQGIGVAFTKN